VNDRPEKHNEQITAAFEAELEKKHCTPLRHFANKLCRVFKRPLRPAAWGPAELSGFVSTEVKILRRCAIYLDGETEAQARARMEEQ